MKQCPVCKTVYPDVTLSFCLADGASLQNILDAEQADIWFAERKLLLPNVEASISPERPNFILVAVAITFVLLVLTFFGIVIITFFAFQGN